MIILSTYLSGIKIKLVLFVKNSFLNDICIIRVVLETIVQPVTFFVLTVTRSLSCYGYLFAQYIKNNKIPIGLAK